MRCLIDGDIFLYELGHSSQYKDEDGNLVVLSFDWVEEALAQRIREIEEECWSDEPSVLYLTCNSSVSRVWNRKLKTEGLPTRPYLPNYRETIAVSKPYKGTRKAEKPFHYTNLIAHMLANYDVKIAEGMEADDLICIDQLKAEPNTTIICTRDKDLRIVEGMHFGWPCGKQPQFGPKKVSKLGELELKSGKLKGEGLKFFYSQLITGDGVDNIPGLPRGGPTMAYAILNDCTTEEEMFKAVAEKYRLKMGDSWKDYMLEQGLLLWMVQELDEEGEPVMWELNEEWL